jgi:hypothetical protein
VQVVDLEQRTRELNLDCGDLRRPMSRARAHGRGSGRCSFRGELLRREPLCCESGRGLLVFLVFGLPGFGRLA